MPEQITPLVSVVIPCYNCEGFIEETIRSVLGQTYRNLELVVVNDGSVDGSLAVIEKLWASHNFILINQANAGVSAARNAGILRASGTVIALLDADDWMYPENIEEKIRLMTDSDADLVYSAAEITDAKLNPTGIFPGANPDHFGEELFVFANPPVPSPSSAVVKKSVLLDAGLFNPAFSVAADLDMWIRVSFIGKVARVGKPLVKYRIVQGSMNTNINGQVKDVSAIIEKYQLHPKVKPYIRRFRKAFYYSIIGNSYHTRNIGRFVRYAFKYLLS